MRFYEIPDTDSLVGLSDGVDAWVCPTTTSDPISTMVHKALKEYRISGKVFTPQDATRSQRKTFNAPAATLPTPATRERRTFKI